MPSPVAHSLAGLTVAALFDGHDDASAAASVLLANAADVDIILAFMTGEHPNAYHGQATHSLAATLLAGLGAGAGARLAGSRFAPSFERAVVAYASHLLLDYFSKESADGLPLLWPLSERRFAASRSFFRTIYSKRGHYLSGLFRRSNLKAVAREAAALLPCLLLARLLTR